MQPTCYAIGHFFTGNFFIVKFVHLNMSAGESGECMTEQIYFFYIIVWEPDGGIDFDFLIF